MCRIPPRPISLRQDFDVAAAGDESRNQSSTFIINGRVSQQSTFGHVYHYRLTPRRSGKLTIPAPRATVDGKTVTGNALELNVVAPEPQDLVVPEIRLDRQRLYPTQPLEVTLRVLVRPLPDEPERDPVLPLRRRPPHLEVNWVDLPPGLSGVEKTSWLRPLLSDDGGGFTLNDITARGSAFSFFEGPKLAVFNLARGREQRKGLDGQSVNYFVYELKRTVTARKPGTYRFGPAVVKGSFVQGLDGGSYTGRRLVAVAPAAALEVRDVPEPRPATFCGGIGDYRVRASASPTSLRVGDPLTLTLMIERRPGSGSVDLISAPQLQANPRIAADFEILDRNPTGHTQGDTKQFAYALRPRRPGASVPAVSVTVFDPDKEVFRELASEPIELSVEAASPLAGDLVGALGGSGSPEIKSRRASSRT